MNKDLRYWAVAVLAWAFALGRLALTTRTQLSWPMTYEALAHVFVGFLLAAFAFTREWFYLGVLLALTAVEVLAFVALR